MPRWLPRVLKRIRALAAARRVQFTEKARSELAQLDLGLDQSDACDVLASLGPSDYAGRTISQSTGEWMYVFKPEVAGTVVYVKAILRAGGCRVISFHEQGEEDDG